MVKTFYSVNNLIRQERRINVLAVLVVSLIFQIHDYGVMHLFVGVFRDPI